MPEPQTTRSTTANGDTDEPEPQPTSNSNDANGDADFLANHGGSPDDPLRKKGIPLWVFQFMTYSLWLCPLDAYILFPILLVILLAVVGVFVALGTSEYQNILIWVLVGALASLILSLWLSWVQRHPHVPNEEDVAKISIQEGRWPKAPVAPLRGELVAKGSSWFKDPEGRRLLLRGINLAGGTKLPREPPEQRGTHMKASDEFFNYKGVSFVGRPFPLEEADLHLGRLRAMGLTFLRFLVTWEAVEHDGPGFYDEEYLTYLKAVVQQCHSHGISVFIDFHQDVWSRWTGGDGAPAWTLEKVGFALDKLHASGAALTQQHWDEEVDGEYPKMVWNSNNARLAAGTMWTLFFAGDDFAPKTRIDGEPVQQYLQRHFCDAVGRVAQVLKDEPNVVGVDLINEPSVGFVRVQDGRDIGPNQYYVGWRVDPWTAMKLGAGKTCSVDYFSSFMVLDGKRELNQDQVCAWKNGPTSCVWHQNGVWDFHQGEPRLLKPKFFATNPRTGLAINFLDDYSLPFVKRAAKAVRKHMPDAIIFAEPVLDMTEPMLTEKPVMTADEVGGGYVWARHYYDGITLMTKSFSRYLGLDPVTSRVSIGMKAIQVAYGQGIMTYKKEASKLGPGGCPVLIGEVGIPFDLGHGHKACGRVRGTNKLAFGDGDFSRNTQALNTSMRALEHAKVSYTLWTYEAENTNKYGDNWNGEDLSLFSRDQVEPGDEDNLFAGGRSLIAAIRPYPCRVAGDILAHSFHLYREKRKFVLVFAPDHSLTTRETTMFVPKYQYPRGIKVHVVEGDGTYEMDWDLQMLTFTHSESSTTIKIIVTKILGRRLEIMDGALVPPVTELGGGFGTASLDGHSPTGNVVNSIVNTV